MGFSPIRSFLSLYPPFVQRAMRIGAIGAAVASILDFLSLLCLLPVFTSLTSGDGSPTPISELVPLSVEAYIVLAMIMMIARSVSAYFLRSWWIKRVAASDVALSNRLLEAYVHAPYEFHLQNNSADLMSRAVSNVNVATFSGLSGLLLVVTDVTTVVALTAALLVASPLPGAIVCGYVALVGGLFAFMSRRYTSRYSREYASQVTVVYHRTSTVLRGVRELTVANAQHTVLGSIRRARSAMTQAQRRLTLLVDFPRLTMETALYGAVLVALLIVLASPHPSNSLPVVALYVVAGLRVLPAVSRGLGNLTQIRSGFEIGAELKEELERLRVARRGAKQLEQPAPRLAGGERLSLNGVSFAYSGGSEVLTDVSLVVGHGEFVGLVGASGGGKSTLLNLVLGLLEPTRGSIGYGPHAVHAGDPAWFSLIGYVPQESYMLDDSVLANVSLGFDEVDMDRARTSLDRAGLGEVVASLPQGIHTGVGENGNRLSVGQRQRLGLARALYRTPAILLLDEPTAALDESTERLVIETIDGLRGAMTIIMVSHRREPLRGADTIYRISDGMITSEQSRIFDPR